MTSKNSLIWTLVCFLALGPWRRIFKERWSWFIWRMSQKLHNMCASHLPFHLSFQIAKQIVQIEPWTLNIELSIVDIFQGAGHRLSHLGLQLRRLPWTLRRLLFLHIVGSGEGFLHARSLCMQINIYAGEIYILKDVIIAREFFKLA